MSRTLLLPAGRASSPLTAPDQPAPVVAIDHSLEAAAALAAGLDGRAKKAG